MKIIKVASNSKTSAVAGSVAHAMRENGRVQLQGIGAGAVNQMIKAVIMAKQFLAEENMALTFVPDFINLQVEGKLCTAVRLTLQMDQFWNETDHNLAQNRVDLEDRNIGENDHNQLLQKTETHHAESPRLSGGDVDAAWDQADVGAETVGGHAPTPDQDVVDELGEAVGLTYADDEPLDVDKKLAERDTHRWELNPASSPDNS